jgi:hypothetical protein
MEFTRYTQRFSLFVIRDLGRTQTMPATANTCAIQTVLPSPTVDVGTSTSELPAVEQKESTAEKSKAEGSTTTETTNANGCWKLAVLARCVRIYQSGRQTISKFARSTARRINSEYSMVLLIRGMMKGHDRRALVYWYSQGWYFLLAFEIEIWNSS